VKQIQKLELRKHFDERKRIVPMIPGVILYRTLTFESLMLFGETSESGLASLAGMVPHFIIPRHRNSTVRLLYRFRIAMDF
jgi:hypothetical protein